MNKNDFLPARLSINVWWGFFWRTAVFALILMQLEQFLLVLVKMLWMNLAFASFVKMMIYTQGHPLLEFFLARISTALLAVFPAMVLAWWMMLSAPVYRTYTLRHIRTMNARRINEVAHGICGATRLGWSTFWRLIVNVAPLYAGLFALQAWQIHLATTTLESVPYFEVMVLVLTLPILYIYPLTIHDILRHRHRHWSLTARPHSHAELLAAFIPGNTPEDDRLAND